MIKNLPNLKDLRGKTITDGSYKRVELDSKTDIAIHHSLTDEGNSEAFARFHVHHKNLPGIAYHFVILKDGTIEWNHDLEVMSFHIGKFDKQSIGICVVGDFRYYNPTEEQKRSLKLLHQTIKLEMKRYERTRGHNEFPGYEWKACPCFDYRSVIQEKRQEADVKRYRLMSSVFLCAEDMTEAKRELAERFQWTLYERAEHTHFNPPYRLLTGTFISKEEAEKFALQIEKELGYTMYIIDS